MSRILLADDSPHAQRMGEFILREEGFEVVSVTDGVTAMLRLADVDPDLVLASVSLPQRNGYQLCGYIKSRPNHRHARVVLTAGALEPIDEEEARRAGADGSLRKPFEASVVIDTAKRLIEAAEQARNLPPAEPATPEPAPVETAAESPPEAAEAAVAVPPVATVAPRPVTDPQSVRAAVTLALECALPVLIDEVTLRVLVALDQDEPSK
jgi:CheY-like chemotaxis protein